MPAYLSSDLNGSIDVFFKNAAEISTAEQWLDENDFGTAVADDAVVEWTAM